MQNCIVMLYKYNWFGHTDTLRVTKVSQNYITRPKWEMATKEHLEKRSQVGIVDCGY